MTMMTSLPLFRSRPAVMLLHVLTMILLQKTKCCNNGGKTPPTLFVPQVSIVIPTFERPELLRFALGQLAFSKQSNLEIIIVDDSSRSQNEDELRSLLRSDDQKLVYYHHPANNHRLSIGQKRNIGAVDLATAPYVVHIDDDDLSCIDRIPYQVQPLMDGKADLTILKHGIWIQFENDSLQQDPVCYQFDSSKTTITPHYGTMAYNKHLLHDTFGLRFPDASLGEDLDFYQRVLLLNHDIIKILELENKNHHLYVRHPFATNRISGHTNRIPSALVKKSASCPNVWEEQILTLSQILFQMQKGKQMVSSSSSNNRQLQQQSPRDTSSSCQCCLNANVCKTMEEAWSMYGCSLSSQICPDVKYWETHGGTCDSCSWGISCTNKYGSYNGCRLVPTNNNNKPDLMPTTPPTRLSSGPPPPPQGVEDCECCLNANFCTTMEEAWNMYGCPIGLLFDDGGHQKVNTCPDVHYWETNVGSCNSCSWGISCTEKYGSYNGCFDIILPPLVSPPPSPPPLPPPPHGGEAECECCSNANVCTTMEEAWNMYGCSLLFSGSCPVVEYWEANYGSCNSCRWGISCTDKYGSYNGCPLVSQTAQTTTSQKKNKVVWRVIAGACGGLLAVAWWWKNICLQEDKPQQHEPTTSSSNTNNASNNNDSNSLEDTNNDGGSVHDSGIMENSTDDGVGGSTKTTTTTTSSAAVDDDGSFLAKNDITCEKKNEESLSHQVFSA